MRLFGDIIRLSVGLHVGQGRRPDGHTELLFLPTSDRNSLRGRKAVRQVGQVGQAVSVSQCELRRSDAVGPTKADRPRPIYKRSGSSYSRMVLIAEAQQLKAKLMLKGKFRPGIPRPLKRGIETDQIVRADRHRPPVQHAVLLRTSCGAHAQQHVHSKRTRTA